jgi:hypothetical protein
MGKIHPFQGIKCRSLARSEYATSTHMHTFALYLIFHSYRNNLVQGKAIYVFNVQYIYMAICVVAKRHYDIVRGRSDHVSD